MKRNLIFILVVLVVIVVLLLLIFAFRSLRTPATVVPQTGTQFPTASSTNPGGVQTNTPQPISIGVQNGQSLTVKDFLNNGTTMKDQENQGVYYLAGSPDYCLPDGSCPSAAAADGFVITYNSTGQSFTIILNKEPLGDSRHKAEQFLQTTLGISNAQMCQLSYYLSTVNAVNETYAGTSLGFSFCPGAVVLP